jgi:hypothetical protein
LLLLLLPFFLHATIFILDPRPLFPFRQSIAVGVYSFYIATANSGIYIKYPFLCS